MLSMGDDKHIWKKIQTEKKKNFTKTKNPILQKN